MESLLSEEVLSGLAMAVASAITFIIGKLIKDANQRQLAEKIVDAAIPVAFHVVQEAARKSPNKIDDKVALGLQKLAEISATHGVELTDKHKERAKLVFSALHAQSKESK